MGSGRFLGSGSGVFFWNLLSIVQLLLFRVVSRRSGQMAMLEMGQGVLEISQYLIYHNNHNHIHINGTRERSVGDGEVRGDACLRCSGFHKKKTFSQRY